MRFRSPLWHPAAIVLSGLNIGGGAFALATGEPMHAGAHAVAAAAFGFWAERLGRRAERRKPEVPLDAVVAELSDLRAELSEAQDRMDVVDRLLARDPDSHRIGGDS